MIKVYLLGHFEVYKAGEAIKDWGSNTYARMVFMYLVTHGKRCNRVLMADALWPETAIATADSHLSKAISQLRKHFTIRTTGHRSVYELIDDIWVDIDEVQVLVLKAEKIGYFSEDGVQYLEQAARLLDRGDCLETESWSWCHAVRVPIEEITTCCRHWLIQSYEQRGLYLNAQVQRRRLEPEGADDMLNRRDILKFVPSVFVGLPLVDYASGVRVLWQLTFENRAEIVLQLLPAYQLAIMTEIHSSTINRKQLFNLLAQLQLIQALIYVRKADFNLTHACADAAFNYAKEAQDELLMAVAIVRQANTWFQSKQFEKARLTYEQAETLKLTPLLAGNTQVGLARTHAILANKQEALKHSAAAYEVYPETPQNDPAYLYTGYGRYEVYVYGDAHTRLLLGQAKEAHDVLGSAEKRAIGSQTNPLSRVDLEYYKVLSLVRLGILDIDQLITATQLAAQAGSKLHLDKNKATLAEMRKRWPNEVRLKSLDLPGVFSD